ncbi:MAG: DNA-binding NarL/FixJ family response regulator [Natronomonas sp.]|jgi:DNA-binding NarL/FixJ family response regulator|uniref:GAF domain-containing protein n=1 Tax=Natronomonas sp. TaxID=2184060 RepID=UPI00398A3954
MVVLHVDPDEGARSAVRAVLRAAGFEGTECRTLAEARLALDSETFDCVITEYDLPDGTGLDVHEHVRETTPDAACVLFTTAEYDAIDTTGATSTISEYVRKADDESVERLGELVQHLITFRSQTAYPLPEHEDARLRALEPYAQNSEVFSEALDRLTEIAAALFDVDSAAIGLIDAHEEQFLSCYGVDVELLDREDAICTFTILEQEEPTIVENVQTDPRFENIQTLADAGIEFYAGMPLVTSEGHAIGTLCLQDDTPRSFSERERELLELLAEEVMDQLELRRRNLEENDE